VTSAVTRFAFRLFGPLAARTISKYPEMSQDFLKARILVHPVAYLSRTYLMVTIAGLVGFAAGLPIATVVGSLSPIRGFALAFVQGALGGILCYLYMMTYPHIRIKARATRIDANLPYALNFVSSLSSAGVIPHKVFGALAQQTEYDLVSDEARWIYRDVQLLGKDIVEALLEASRRSSSRQFSEFLQGTVSTILSGGNLHSYFLQRAAHASEVLRRQQRGYIESLGVLSESYLVTAVAGPLFLIVIVSVLTLVSSRVVDPLYALRIVIFLLLPASHIMFAGLMNKMRPQV
jgi:flagellar protein FlaJ